MAIFSLHHGFIGRTMQGPGAAGSFAYYITRPAACTEIIGEGMPTKRAEMILWLHEQEQTDRKNARVIDTIRVALPVELTQEQNVALLHAFGERMTEGRASWAAAIHDGPSEVNEKGERNPHAHIIFRDRDIETGKRVMLTSEKGSTERFRAAWEQEVNIALEREGFDQRIDRRSLADQGIDREPQIHVGPAAHNLTRRGYQFESNQREITRIVHGEMGPVTVNYPRIDEGKSRFEENEARKARNAERARLEMDGEEPHRPGPENQRGANYLARSTQQPPTSDKGEISGGDTSDPANPPFEWGNDSRSRPERMPPRAGPYPDGPHHHRDEEPSPPVGLIQSIRAQIAELDQDFKDTDKLRKIFDEVLHSASPFDNGTDMFEALHEARRDERNERPVERSAVEGQPKQTAFNMESNERAPRRDVVDALGGAGLAIIGRISDSFESLFDTPVSPPHERERQSVAEERKVQQQVVEKQQQQTEAEREHWRKVELQMYLAQRDRERHVDRGR